MMMAYAMNVLRKQGKRSVHILVREGHEVAMRAYMHLGYEKVGECSLYDMRFVCMEMGAVVKNEIKNNCWVRQAYLPAPNSLSFAIKNKAMVSGPTWLPVQKS